MSILSSIFIFSKYKTIIIVLIILIVSLLLQSIFGVISIDTFKFPVNLFVFIEFFVGIIALYLIFKRHFVVKWLSSSSAAISSIILFSVWVVFMAIIPQIEKEKTPLLFSLNNVLHTWMFAISSAFLIITLGFTILRRSFPFRGRNILFFINHFGLWLTITSGLLGAADRKELTMQVFENQLVWYGQDKNNNITELPFAIKLNKFVMLSYPPKIAVINKQGKPYKLNGDQLFEITKPAKIKIGSYKIDILHFYPEALINDDTIKEYIGEFGTSPATYVNILLSNNKTINGFVSSGSYAQQNKIIEISKDTLLCLLSPEPAYYGSNIVLYTKTNNKAELKKISVNNPIKAEGWTIYQYSYDTKLGKDSPYSVFMIVKDPWLPMVYIGIFMMMVGSILMIFTKANSKTIKEEFS